MYLSKLMADDKDLHKKDLNELKDVDVIGITSDSREVREGYLFAALSGAKYDGRDFIQSAIDKGAIAVLAPQGTKLPKINYEGTTDLPVILIEDKNPRQRFAHMAANLYKTQPDTVVAVTGSNGKTSIAHFVRQIWQNIGFSAASLGTVGIESPVGTKSGSLTTPDPVTLHMELSELANQGISHLAMEASSHGLDQYRLDGIKLSAAGFTNLTRDHLDYHKTMEGYLAAKTRLFADILPENGVAVLNADIPEFPILQKICRGRGQKIISYGKKGEDLILINRQAHHSGQSVELSVFGEKHLLDLPLVGEFQLYNCLCAIGLVVAEHTENQEMCREVVNALKEIKGVRGRLEFIGTHPEGAAIYVDYAHTPDALENILKALRPHVSGKLHVVMGCGGDRDRGKRPMMGKIAKDLADNVIVTDDNPRTEDASFIRSEIMIACPDALEVDDRRRAIQAGILGLKKGDILVIAGKGHEQGQIVGTDIIPFDDATEVRTVLAEIG